MSQIQQQLSLSRFYKGWDVYHGQLVKAVVPLSIEQLALRASPHHWSVGMLITHIVAARVWWFHEKMGEGSPDLDVYKLWDFDVCEHNVDPHHTATELVDGLERTWGMIQATLDRLGVEDLEQAIHIRSWNGEERPSRTRQWIIWHILEHDINHGGEISYILGAHGLAGVDLD